MVMKKDSASTYKIMIRLVRPLFHFLLLVGVFYMGYMIRQSTDLIPRLQLRIPAFNLSETMWFSLAAIIIFVGACFLVGAYDLFRPLHGYYKKFLLAWVWRFVSMTFLALFGNGFLFGDGISRFLILRSAGCGLIVLSIFDIFWNNINGYLEKKQPYKILVIYKDESQYHSFIQDIAGYPIYEVIPVSYDKYDTSRRREGIDIAMAVGSYETNTLQLIADHARNHGKIFYHIPESYFLEDLIAKPERIGPVL